jgi:hypothetical protein
MQANVGKWFNPGPLTTLYRIIDREIRSTRESIPQTPFSKVMLLTAAFRYWLIRGLYQELSSAERSAS